MGILIEDRLFKFSGDGFNLFWGGVVEMFEGTFLADGPKSVGGGVAAHDADAAVGPSEEEAGVVGAAEHTVITGAVADAVEEGDAGDVDIADGHDHFGPVFGDAFIFVLFADHEAGNVLHKEHGGSPLATELDEMGGFEGGFAEEEPVIGDNTNRNPLKVGEATDDGGAVAGFEFAETGAIDEAGDHFADIVGDAGVGGDDAVQFIGVVGGLFWGCHDDGHFFATVEVADDVTDPSERLFFGFGEMVGDATEAGVDIAAAEFFGGDFFTGGGFDEGGAGEEDGAVVFDDNGFISHGGDVGAAGGAGAEDGGDLGDALAAHAGHVVEDAAEMFAVGEDISLEVEEGAAGVDEVDTGEMVILGDILGAEMFFNRFGVVGTAFDSGVVGDDHDFDAGDAADAGDDTGAGGVVIVEIPSGEGGEFEEGAIGVEDGVDAVADEEFAAAEVAVDSALAAVVDDFVLTLTELVGEGTVVFFVLFKFG